MLDVHECTVPIPADCFRADVHTLYVFVWSALFKRLTVKSYSSWLLASSKVALIDEQMLSE